jgi:caffeoyl-CoA O-methyltransferase
MKKHRGNPIVPISDLRIEKYAEKYSKSDSDELKHLIASSNELLEYIDMLSGPIVGGLLQQLIKISKAKTVLEIGTFTGYSAIKMAEALPEDGEVYTLEMNLKYQKIAESHFKKSLHANKIRLIKGNAQQTLDLLDVTFDLVYLDGDKLRYQFYVDKVLPKLISGGLIVADNVLWDGAVLNPQDHKSQSIADFNRNMKLDSRVEVILLPIRDGLSIIRKK